MNKRGCGGGLREGGGLISVEVGGVGRKEGVEVVRVNIIVWGLHKELTTLEVRARFADMGLKSFVRGNVLWEGDHIRLVLMKKDRKGVYSELVKQVSANLRKIGCRCVIDEQVRKTCKSSLHCVNRIESLAIDTCSDDDVEDVPVVDSVALKTKVLA